jgi:transposase InsO family protein
MSKTPLKPNEIKKIHTNIHKLSSGLLKGYKAPKIAGDGNCQFTALAWWFFGSLKNSKQHLKKVQFVREEVSKALTVFQDKLKPSYTGENYEDFVKSVKTTRVWGDYFTLAAAAMYWKVAMLLQYPRVGGYFIGVPQYPDDQVIMLFLNYNKGNRSEGNHYEIGDPDREDTEQIVRAEKTPKSDNTEGYPPSEPKQKKGKDIEEERIEEQEAEKIPESPKIKEEVVQKLENFTPDAEKELDWVRRQDWKEETWDFWFKKVSEGEQPKELFLGEFRADSSKLFYYPEKNERKYFEILKKDEASIELLRQHWANPKTGLRGAETTFLQLSETYIGLSRRWIEQQLNREKGFQEMKPYRKRIVVNPIITTAPRQHWQMDLMDYHAVEFDNVKEGTHSTYKWILTVIDVFSKFAYAQPLVDKTEGSVLEGLMEILGNELNENRGYPDKIQSDNGSEFKNGKMTKFLEGEGIKQVYSRSHTPQTNGCVEKFNGTLTKMIHQYWANCESATEQEGKKVKNRNWVDVLQDIVSNYNNTPHSTTRMVPVKLHFAPDVAIVLKAAERIRIKGKKVLEKRGLKFAISNSSDSSKGKFPVQRGDRVRVAMRSLFPVNSGGKHIHVTNWSRRTWAVEKTDPEQGLVKIAKLPGSKSRKGWLKINEVQVVKKPFKTIVGVYCKKRNKSAVEIAEMNSQTSLQRRKVLKELEKEETLKSVEPETSKEIPGLSENTVSSEEFQKANNPVAVALEPSIRKSKRQIVGVSGRYKDYVDPDTIKISKTNRQKPKPKQKKK